MASGSDERKRKVAYFYEPSIGDFDYGKHHFMKRIRMTDNLVQSFDLYKHMDIVKPFRADEKQLTMFHSKDYIKFLKSVAPGMIMNAVNKKKFTKFCIDADCPPFDGVYEFSQISAGGSICAASYLTNKKADIAINWAGGLHHAKMTHASGFCYVNDIVLGILELLKFHDRVLYVDIDIHHGDGVEEAFYTTDRVMNVSFHKYGGNFFPETGNFMDVGHGVGENYNVNVPLDVGIDDTDFRFLFEPVIQKVMEMYQPNAVVLQCGADSLAGDPIGEFNLSIKGHASCLEFLRSFNVPLMVLGGGGYKPENVARCWCYETSVAVGVEINSDHPSLPLSLVGARSYRNKNKRKDLEELRNLLIERISRLPNSPSVQFMHVVPQTKVPEEAEDPIERRPKSRILRAEVDD